MATAFCDQLKTWLVGDISTLPRVILLKGAGEKAFCAGGDVASIARALLDPKLD